MSGRIVRDLPDATYHSDLSTLSASGAKALLDCPARFRHQQLHGRPDRDAFDFGHAAHRFVLGKGATIARVHAPDWRSSAARVERTMARANAQTPLLTDDYRRALDVAKAVKRHPIAGPLFANGEAEVSLYADDPETGIPLRGRVDWRTTLADGRDCIVDVKTTTEGGANPSRIPKTVADFKYDMAAAHYLALAVATGYVEPDCAFLHVFVEKTPPYPVTVAQLDDEALERGRSLMRRAIDLYRECTLTDEWPAYGTDVALISLPGWALPVRTML